MLNLLDRIAAHPGNDSIYFLTDLVQKLRPAKPYLIDEAAANVRTFTQLLQGRHSHALALRHYLLRVFSTRHQTNLYTDTGILSSTGFFSELFQRFSFRILPPAVDESNFRDCLDRILPVQTDYVWMSGVPAADWQALFDVLDSADEGDVDTACKHKTLLQLLEAIQTLSYRISSMGLEPELIRNHPDLETFDSPFLTQNFEVNRYLKGYARFLNSGAALVENDKHLLVMLDQCETVVNKIRKNALSLGTSVALTYLLVRLTQSIERMRKLLALLDVSRDLHPFALECDADTCAVPTQRSAAALALGLELVEAHNRKYAVRELFASNINLLARNVTENASRTGEHYIAENRSEYAAMFRSAAGAGFIIGFMAMFKIFASYLRAAPLVEAFLYSLNYSLGFMLIHVLHFTVATKQPAMTAARIAAELHSRDGHNIDLDSLAELIAKVMRTQFVAVLGNIIVAFPMAYLLAWGYFYLQGQHIVTPEKAGHLLHDIDPLHSLALFHAAIAGVCLFVAGLISGYYDNKAIYARIPARIAQLRWLQRVLGEVRLKKLAAYIENNLGGLMGNLYFGILLGSIGTLGFMLGLPIDIRHVTFAAANFATSLFSLDNDMTWQTAVTSTLGVLSIGAVNLLVSFSLALFVALRSRQVRFSQWPALLKVLLTRFVAAPLDFFLPPKNPVKDKTKE
ncbi:MAG TPA: site-specific recombinase [Gallionellaceae bacterium]|nr:site-specific recombinase [Gallionellaceae bacterium]